METVVEQIDGRVNNNQDEIQDKIEELKSDFNNQIESISGNSERKNHNSPMFKNLSLNPMNSAETDVKKLPKRGDSLVGI